MAEGTVIELKPRRPCNICKRAIGHEVECPRSPERMRAMTAERERRVKTGEVVRKGGRKKKLRVTRQELEELAKQSAGEMLYGDRETAVGVLRKQMGSKDERTAQKAALAILAYTDGTPTQKIEQKTDQITTVEYRSAALMFEDDAAEPPVAEQSA